MDQTEKVLKEAALTVNRNALMENIFDFKRDYFPIYEYFGFSLVDAYKIYLSELTIGALEELLEKGS
jgi:hypothetical protein